MLITSPPLRRYLVPIDSPGTQQIFSDCLVIGSGLAGLRAALEAAKTRKVTLVCKAALVDSNTWNAQGGIASVLEQTDSFDAHIADTLQAGCGLCDPDIVRLVVENGPPQLKELTDWGTDFDQIDGKIDTTLEGGHTHARVVHARGDATGQAIAESLIHQIKHNPNIRVMENFYTIDLLTSDPNHCLGAIGKQHTDQPLIIWARATILATGGAGRLYRETTNPRGATADGLAMASRAGAVLRDLELMQFHPTTLYIAGASRALVTETLRGEGAVLLDMNKEKFMQEYHPKAELAPRDVVSRAILDRMLKTNATHVFLDVRHIPKDHFVKRFPHISELCESFDIDVSKDLIPVRPSAHYMIGGIKTDANAQTSLPALFAAGEVASTGLHGANRLGSNSLLESLVFGMIAGKNAAALAGQTGPEPTHHSIQIEIPESSRTRLDAGDVINSLRALMWRNVGITRTAQQLSEAQEIITFWQRYVMDKVFNTPFEWECQNMLTVAMLMARSAMERKESRGVHFRPDFPETSDKFASHIETRTG